MSKDFDKKRNDAIVKINEAIESYDVLVNSVSPRNYRTTGNHYHELNKVKVGISDLEEITPTEKKKYDLYTEKYL